MLSGTRVSRSLRRLGRAFLLGLLLTPSVQAQSPGDPFPRPPELATAIAFWKAIYAQYGVNQVVFHHPDHLDVIYRVLDMSDAARVLDDEDQLRKLRREQVKAIKDEIKRDLLRLADLPEGARPAQDLQPMVDLLRKVPGGREKYRRAAEWVRAQRGLKEKFAYAVEHSGVYMPYIENVFRQKGLPRQLSRLPFVESSFNEKAYSRSGAAGIWQFMPGSARQYMRYDEVADQRRDPWFSTHAAAGHLADDYALLQDWPLAVTAYNYGRNGLARAREQTGYTSLVELIQHWDGPRWGFAAKNFYAEFVAAVEVEADAQAYFGVSQRKPVQRFDEVATRHFVEYSTLQELSGLDADEFRRLNPSFSQPVREGRLYVPPGQMIRTPRGEGVRLAKALVSLPEGLRFDRQKDYLARYKVRRGDSLSKIAARFRSSIGEIMRLNDLRSASLIRVGQVLRIPSPGGQAPQPPPRTALTHKVQRGETLSQIARRYGTNVSTLMAENNIGQASWLQAGQVLKIRAGTAARLVRHRIRQGDTLSALARRYGTSIAQIRQDNNLRDIHSLQVGKTLTIAQADDYEASRAPLRHKIRSGQTLEGIARRYGVSTRSLIRHNNISNPDQIQIGDYLSVPRG